MGSSWTKKRKNAEIKTNDQNQTDKPKSPNQKNRAQSPREDSDFEIAIPEDIKRLEKHAQNKHKNDEETMSFPELNTLNPDRWENWIDSSLEYPEDLIKKLNLVDLDIDLPELTQTRNYDVNVSSSIYPSSGSSFCIRPLTPEKPITVTALSTINQTKEKVTS